MWGCIEKDGIAPLGFDGEALKRCPLLPYKKDPHWYAEVNSRSLWTEKGYLSDPGTIQDQPAKMVQALEIISRAQSDAEQENRETKKSSDEARSQGMRG